MTAFLALLLLVQDPTQEDYEKWVDQLGADYQEERLQAYQNLEKAGIRAEEALTYGVEHQDFRVRRACVELLTKCQSKKVVKQAAKAFKDDPDRSVRQVSFAYLQMCGLDAEDALIDALDRPEEEFRLGALKTLTEARSQKCAEKVADLYDREPAGEIKNMAFQCLQNIGVAAKPYLLKLLGSQDASVRDKALLGLENIKAEDDDAVAAVSRLFQVESDGGVQQRAFSYLQSKGKRAERAFLDGLGSAQEAIRIHSIRGLSEIKSDKALDRIADLFDKDATETVRKDSLEYLKALGLKSEARLLGSLDNENPAVRLMAIEGLGAIKSPKPLARISKMFREDPDAKVHRVAFDYLKNVGRPAEDDLIFALKDSVPEIRMEAIEALGRARSEKAVAPLLELLSELNPQLRDAARDALVRVGPPAVEAVKAAAKEGKVKPKLADQIVQLHEQEEVERILDRLITPQGGTGFFAGQFEDLKSFGAVRAIPVLLKMIEPGYALRMPDKKGAANMYDRYMRELAIMALGELGDKSVLPRLLERIKNVSPSFGDDEYEELVIASFRLGDRAPFDKFVEEMKKEAEENLKSQSRSYNRVFSIAMVQNRVGEREDALGTYERLRAAIEENKAEESSEIYDSVLYNIACLHSLAGRKERAIEVLEKAVKSGFKDREWIKLDKDLDPLRGEEGFQRLLSNDALFDSSK